MEHADDKKSLRAHFLRIRAEIPAETRAHIDAGITARTLALPAYQQADAVFTYLAMGDEVETRGIIFAAWATGKAVVLPRCIPGTRRMDWHVVKNLEGLVKSRFGVDEPANDPATRIDPARFSAPLAVVPGLTFDSRGFRLGYGGGFYDVFLAGFEGTSVGLCRESQLSAGIPFLDAYDMPVHYVATEKRLITAE